jgi:hypothetical protein
MRYGTMKRRIFATVAALSLLMGGLMCPLAAAAQSPNESAQGSAQLGLDSEVQAAVRFPTLQILYAEDVVVVIRFGNNIFIIVSQ